MVSATPNGKSQGHEDLTPIGNDPYVQDETIPCIPISDLHQSAANASHIMPEHPLQFSACRFSCRASLSVGGGPHIVIPHFDQRRNFSCS